MFKTYGTGIRIMANADYKIVLTDLWYYKQYGEDTLKEILNDIDELPPEQEWENIISEEGENLLDVNPCSDVSDYLTKYLRGISLERLGCIDGTTTAIDEGGNFFDVIFENWSAEEGEEDGPIFKEQHSYLESLLDLEKDDDNEISDSLNYLIENMDSPFREHLIIIKFQIQYI
jgi:hypothetical protein